MRYLNNTVKLDITEWSLEWQREEWISSCACFNRYFAFRTKALDELFHVTNVGVDGWTCCYVFERFPVPSRAFIQFHSIRFDKITSDRYETSMPAFRNNNRVDWEYHRLDSWKINDDNPDGLKAELERIIIKVIPVFEKKALEMLNKSE